MNIDKIRPDFMDLIANHFQGKFNIDIPCDNYRKLIKSNLFAEVSPLEIYTRSIKYHISFDKYEKEFIFYTSVNKSLERMIKEFQDKIDKIVIDTFIENDEEERLKGFQYNVFEKMDLNKFILTIENVEKRDTQIL